MSVKKNYHFLDGWYGVDRFQGPTPAEDFPVEPRLWVRGIGVRSPAPLALALVGRSAQCGEFPKANFGCVSAFQGELVILVRGKMTQHKHKGSADVTKSKPTIGGCEDSL